MDNEELKKHIDNLKLLGYVIDRVIDGRLLVCAAINPPRNKVYIEIGKDNYLIYSYEQCRKFPQTY